MRLKLLAALSALPLLAACAPEIESTLYLEDVLAALSDSTVKQVPAVLRIPQSSEESCTKGLTALIEKLRPLAPVTGDGKCIEKSGDQLAELETQLNLVPEGVSDDTTSIFFVDIRPAAGATADAPSLSLSFRLGMSLDELTNALAADSDELTADFDPAQFIFTLNNDVEGQNVDVFPLQVFADRAPAMPGDPPITLGYRDETELVLSNVASEYVSRAKSYEFAIIAPAPAN
jgi:hypothetical protein